MKDNPFVLPGFGQSGAMSENPILASMEMMRQAWEGLARAGNMDPAAMGMMSMEELDKRISDLRAVENWLRMNLSMLGSTIRGMEVQRATMATLKSVVETGMSAAAGAAESGRSGGSSPLEDVLMAWQGPSSNGRQQAAGSHTKPEPTTSSASHAGADAQSSSKEQNDVMDAAASAAQGWWNLLQQQFQTLAAATVASAEGAMASTAAAGAKAAESVRSASESATTKRSSASRKSTSASGKTATAKKAAKKAVAKKAAKRSTTARKSAR